MSQPLKSRLLSVSQSNTGGAEPTVSGPATTAAKDVKDVATTEAAATEGGGAQEAINTILQETSEVTHGAYVSLSRSRSRSLDLKIDNRLRLLSVVDVRIPFECVRMSLECRSMAR